MNIRASGKYYEYKVLKILEQNGYKVVRIPTSASGKQPLPDLIATKDNTIFAIEVKSTSKNYVDVDEYQIEKLFKFCEMFSFCECKPTVIVMFKNIRKIKITYVSRREKVRIRAD